MVKHICVTQLLPLEKQSSKMQKTGSVNEPLRSSWYVMSFAIKNSDMHGGEMWTLQGLKMHFFLNICEFCVMHQMLQKMQDISASVCLAHVYIEKLWKCRVEQCKKAILKLHNFILCTPFKSAFKIMATGLIYCMFSEIGLTVSWFIYLLYTSIQHTVH